DDLADAVTIESKVRLQHAELRGDRAVSTEVGTRHALPEPGRARVLLDRGSLESPCLLRAEITTLEGHGEAFLIATPQGFGQLVHAERSAPHAMDGGHGVRCEHRGGDQPARIRPLEQTREDARIPPV